jgi:hypothetical protein
MAARALLGICVVLAACGGSAIRPPAEPEPEGEPSPAGEQPPASPDAADDDAGPDADPGAPGEDAAAAEAADEDAPAPPPDLSGGDTVAPASCGGVRCPRLFDIVTACRPGGACTARSLLTTQHRCYDNGVKVVATTDVAAGGFTANVSQPDGMTACYRVEVSRAVASGNTNFIWRDPDGLPIATGVSEASGRRTVTCDGFTSELTDVACLALPPMEDCPSGACS